MVIEIIFTIQYGMSVQFKYIPNVCPLIFYDNDAIQSIQQQYNLYDLLIMVRLRILIYGLFTCCR